jgi:hypothetical protein
MTDLKLLADLLKMPPFRAIDQGDREAFSDMAPGSWISYEKDDTNSRVVIVEPHGAVYIDMYEYGDDAHSAEFHLVEGVELP